MHDPQHISGMPWNRWCPLFPAGKAGGAVDFEFPAGIGAESVMQATGSRCVKPQAGGLRKMQSDFPGRPDLLDQCLRNSFSFGLVDAAKRGDDHMPATVSTARTVFQHREFTHRLHRNPVQDRSAGHPMFRQTEPHSERSQASFSVSGDSSSEAASASGVSDSGVASDSGCGSSVVLASSSLANYFSGSPLSASSQGGQQRKTGRSSIITLMGVPMLPRDSPLTGQIPWASASAWSTAESPPSSS